MKKLTLLLLPFLLGCKKDEAKPKEQQSCNCYKVYQEYLAPNGWVTSHTETPQPELCEKDGLEVYSSLYNRYVWNCN